MSVLAKLIQERQQWEVLQKGHQARRTRFLAVEYGVLLALGLLVILYYHQILATMMIWLGR